MQITESFVLKIIEKFSAGKIDELELDDGTSRLVLKKNSTPNRGGSPSGLSVGAADGVGGGAAASVGGSTTDGTTGAATGGAANAAAQGMAAAESFSGAKPDAISSPIVGIFYPSLSPDSPPLVRPGSKVKTGDTLCILEAMKMMNHLVAEFDCEILAVKAASGDLVEYGQVLFEVKRL